MKKNSLKDSKEMEDIFSRPPTSEDKAWVIVYDFYHLVNVCMVKKKMNQSKLAKELGISRAAVSQMLNQEPSNMTIKKMVETANAVGFEVRLDIDTKRFTFEPIRQVEKVTRIEFVQTPVEPLAELEWSTVGTRVIAPVLEETETYEKSFESKQYQTYGNVASA